jgi:hypothetical protein
MPPNAAADVGGVAQELQPRLGNHEESKVESSPIAPVDDWRYSLEGVNGGGHRHRRKSTGWCDVIAVPCSHF